MPPDPAAAPKSSAAAGAAARRGGGYQEKAGRMDDHLVADWPLPGTEDAMELYAELGVRPVIHCAGTKTKIGGSRLDPRVLAAMHAASRLFVPVAELNHAVGRYIARITGAQAGMVTGGAGSGVVLSMAASMTGTDPARIARLPNTDGMPDQLVIMRTHFGKYTHMYRYPGAQLVEVGNMNECHLWEFQAALNQRTAAIAYLEGPGIRQVGPTLAQLCAEAHAHGIPVIVDAAAMLPPRSNLRRYICEGADLVTMSGGKMIHGPQGTGLLFGRADLVAAAQANNNPNHAVGRSDKVSREDLVGLYTALKLYMSSDEDAVLASYARELEPIVRALAGIPGLAVSIEHDQFRYHVPTAVIRFGPRWKGPSPEQVTTALFEGSPRVYVVYDRSLAELQISPVSLQAGEAALVARRLRQELT